MGLKVSEQGGEGVRATGQSGMLLGLGRVWQQGRAGLGGAGRAGAETVLVYMLGPRRLLVFQAETVSQLSPGLGRTTGLETRRGKWTA